MVSFINYMYLNMRQNSTNRNDRRANDSTDLKIVYLCKSIVILRCSFVLFGNGYFDSNFFNVIPIDF